MDIAVGDVIEVWLTPGEYGLEPALGGNIGRKITSLTHYTEVFVLIILALILFSIYIMAGKSTK